MCCIQDRGYANVYGFPEGLARPPLRRRASFERVNSILGWGWKFSIAGKLSTHDWVDLRVNFTPRQRVKLPGIWVKAPSRSTALLGTLLDKK